jgi:hypothetical protein
LEYIYRSNYVSDEKLSVSGDPVSSKQRRGEHERQRSDRLETDRPDRPRSDYDGRGGGYGYPGEYGYGDSRFRNYYGGHPRGMNF